MQHEINRLAEFKDKEVEKKFHENEIRKGLRTSKYTILIFSVVHLAFVLVDYFYLSYEDVSVVLYHSLLPRILIFFMAVAVFILLERDKDKQRAIKSVLVFLILTYLLHEHTAAHFAPVDLMFEVLDLVLLTFGIFIVPNRWIENLSTSFFLVAVFLFLTPVTIPAMEAGDKVVTGLYLCASTKTEFKRSRSASA